MPLENRYFLAANTPSGFFSYFDEVYPKKGYNHAFIIKGGPGTGKSTFMRKVADFFAGQSSVDYVYCSSDPDSLDAVIIKDKGILFMDGTAPHVMDPKLPGAADEIINLGEFWDRNALKLKRQEIYELSKKISSTYKNAYQYLLAAQNIRTDSFAIAESALLRKKLDALASRIIKREFRIQKDCEGICHKRFLSGLTPKGLYNFLSDEKTDFRIYRISDEYHISSMLLEKIKNAALEYGYDVHAAYCPIMPGCDIEHLFIPELKLGFVTCNSYHSYDGQFERHLNLSRYLDEEIMKLRKVRLRFNKKTFDSLLEKALEHFEIIKRMHDELEVFYASCMDFKKLEAFRIKLISELDAI